MGILDSSGFVSIFKFPVSLCSQLTQEGSHFSTISNLYRKCIEGIFSSSAWTTIPAMRDGRLPTSSNILAQFGPHPFSINIAVSSILYVYEFDPNQQGVFALASCHRIATAGQDDLMDTPVVEAAGDDDSPAINRSHEWVVLEETSPSPKNTTDTVPW
jgi:hypothetical protein